MEYIKIVLLAIAAAISYGILHDQITVRVCIEYFTIGSQWGGGSSPRGGLDCSWEYRCRFVRNGEHGLKSVPSS